MTNIPIQPAAWPEIPLIVETDPVLGGLNGPANRQAIAIAQRIQYAMAAVDMVAGVGTQAKALADQALGLASSADAVALAAQSAAATADTKASTAQTTATQADTKAAQADTKASSAQTTATAADTKATQADTKATAAQTTAATAAADAKTAMTTAAAKTTRVFLGTISITYTAALALGAGARSIEATCTGARVGDAIFVSPSAAVPDGYAIGSAQCLIADKIRVSIVHPALVLGANFTIPVLAFALR